jgi:hypothetical protein
MAADSQRYRDQRQVRVHKVPPKREDHVHAWVTPHVQRRLLTIYYYSIDAMLLYNAISTCCITTIGDNIERYNLDATLI